MDEKVLQVEFLRKKKSFDVTDSKKLKHVCRKKSRHLFFTLKIDAWYAKMEMCFAVPNETFEFSRFFQ